MNLLTAPDAQLVCLDPWGSVFEKGSELQIEFEGNRKVWERNIAATGQINKVGCVRQHVKGSAFNFDPSENQKSS